MRKLIVGANDANQRVDKFLSKALPSLPKSLMYKYIRNKKIKVNGKRCEISQRLFEKDELTCYIAEEFFERKKDDSFLKAPSQLNIIYEDAHILIMNKPVGLLCHSDENGQVDTLVNRMKHYLYKKGEYRFEMEQSFVPALCHRIDRNTQGIVIGAKDAQSLRDMNQRIHDCKIEKQYLCLVEGKMEKSKAVMECYHKKENQRVYISDFSQPGYKKIKTGYQVLEETTSLSLLKVDLYSGKSHQIRAVMAHLHHPLYGDTRYQAKKVSYPYQALCAYRIRFLESEDGLSYLNHKEFSISKNEIDFLSLIKK